MKKICRSSILVGLILYLAADVCFCLTHLDISDSAFSASLTAAFALCGIGAILLLIWNRASLKSQLLSGLILQLTFWGFFVLDSLIGITRSFVPLAEDNHAAGLVLLFFWLHFTGISVIGFICTGVVRFLRKTLRTK